MELSCYVPEEEKEPGGIHILERKIALSVIKKDMYLIGNFIIVIAYRFMTNRLLFAIILIELKKS